MLYLNIAVSAVFYRISYILCAHIRATATLIVKLWLWHESRAHRKRDLLIKLKQNYALRLEVCVLDVFFGMCSFRCKSDLSHSSILKFSGAVATFSRVTILKMWLWLVFWACPILQKRFELTTRARDVLQILPGCQSRGPGEVRERLLSFSFQSQYTVGS